jgi:hypothetical protein
VLQSPFLELPTVGIHKCNLLKARVVICSYNDHVRLLSPSPLVGFSTTKVYSGIGADIVMESITLKSPAKTGCYFLPSANSPSEACCTTTSGPLVLPARIGLLGTVSYA